MEVSHAWTPGSDAVVFRSDRSGAGEWKIYTRPTDGGGDVELLFDPDESSEVGRGFSPTHWMGPSALLTDSWQDREGVSESGAAATLDPQSSDQGRKDLELVRLSSPSPDGHWLAYVSEEFGSREVYLTPFPAAGEKRLVSRSGGSRVAWSRDGREIYFENSGQLWAVEVTGPEGRLSEPKTLFSMEPFWRGGYFTLPNWDVSPDGEHFLMRHTDVGEDQSLRHLVIVTDLFEQLREKVPADF